MLNFGVREVALSTAPQGPGWAYVPDTGINASVAALQPAARKRHRTELTSNTELSAKQDAKILRDIKALEQENHRDVAIPIPARPKDNLGRASQTKPTPGVRKILLSQKTFANHLADYEAMGSQPQPVTPVVRTASTTAQAPPGMVIKRSHKKKDPNAPPPPIVYVPASSFAASSHISIYTPVSSKAPPLPPHPPITFSMGSSKEPPKHPKDGDALLKSRIPVLPSNEEVERLLAIPALGYVEARGGWMEEDRRKPVRKFCEVCGYWGRVRCGRCGGRVCALECLGVHQEECFARYGA